MAYRSRSGKASSKAALKAKEAKAQADDAAGPAKDVVNKSLLSRAFDSNSSIEPEEVLEIVHWFRQAQAVVLGILYGVFKITGAPGLSSFIGLTILGPIAFVKQIHEYDEDEVSKIGLIALEGMLPAFALFLLTWIITYTIFL